MFECVIEVPCRGCGLRDCRQVEPVHQLVGGAGKSGRGRIGDEGGREQCDHVGPEREAGEHELRPAEHQNSLSVELLSTWEISVQPGSCDWSCDQSTCEATERAELGLRRP